MKIFLPFTIKGIGGVSTFAAKFKAGLEAAGHTVTLTFEDDYDLLFLIVQAPVKYLRHAKKHRRPIVQRLDGVFYWSVAGWRFPLLNAKAAYIRHRFTDFTIYQSQYSQTSVNRFLGPKGNDPHKIVYNGVDLNHFSPQGEKENLRDYPEQKIFFTASVFRRRDQIEPILRALEIYQRKFGSDYKLVIAGTFSREVINWPAQLAQSKNIQLLGKVSNHDLPGYERAADVFLFTHLNPPCPNNVIEALACGLPICGISDGAMPELVENGDNGLLIPANGSGYWTQRPFAAETFADNLQQIISNREAMGQKSRRLAEQRFSLDRMVEEYIQVFRSLVN